MRAGRPRRADQVALGVVDVLGSRSPVHKQQHPVHWGPGRQQRHDLGGRVSAQCGEGSAHDTGIDLEKLFRRNV